MPEYFIPAGEFNSMTYEWMPDCVPELAKMIEELGKGMENSTKVYRIVVEERFSG